MLNVTGSKQASFQYKPKPIIIVKNPIGIHLLTTGLMVLFLLSAVCCYLS